MKAEWTSGAVFAADGRTRAWACYTCPRCAGAVLVEVLIYDSTLKQPGEIKEGTLLHELQAIPSGQHDRYHVDHLPEDIQSYFGDAIRVLDAGVPDAAAVQLRRTLEAAAAHRGIEGRNLVQRIEKMIDEGFVTRDFGDVLNHVRKIGNLGAHYTDERLTHEEVEQALKFTTQILRNLYEVPGELELLQKSASEDSAS